MGQMLRKCFLGSVVHALWGPRYWIVARHIIFTACFHKYQVFATKFMANFPLYQVPGDTDGVQYTGDMFCQK